MYQYSKRSSDRLAICDERLQRVFNEVIRHRDCTILCGHRNEDEQNEAYRKGFSKLRYPASKHNRLPSSAVDVLPCPIDWKDTERMAHFAGFVLGVAASMGIHLRSGIDWDSDGYIKDHSFLDYPHFEVVDD